MKFDGWLFLKLMDQIKFDIPNRGKGAGQVNIDKVITGQELVFYTDGHFVLVKGSFSFDFVSCTFQPNPCFIAEHFQISG